MANFKLLTLSGITTDPRAGLNYIMSCFFFSKYSQTELYTGSIVSLTDIIKRHGNNTTDIQEGIKNGLEELLSRYFDFVSLDIGAVDDNANIEVSIKGSVVTTDSTGEVRLDMGYVLSARDGAFKKIIDVLNNEVLY